jgi:hypothetical protein
MQKAIQANDKRNATILNHQGNKKFVGFLKPTISYTTLVSSFILFLSAFILCFRVLIRLNAREKHIVTRNAIKSDIIPVKNFNLKKNKLV